MLKSIKVTEITSRKTWEQVGENFDEIIDYDNKPWKIVSWEQSNILEEGKSSPEKKLVLKYIDSWNYDGFIYVDDRGDGQPGIIDEKGSQYNGLTGPEKIDFTELDKSKPVKKIAVIPKPNKLDLVF